MRREAPALRRVPWYPGTRWGPGQRRARVPRARPRSLPAGGAGCPREHRAPAGPARGAAAPSRVRSARRRLRGVRPPSAAPQRLACPPRSPGPLPRCPPRQRLPGLRDPRCRRAGRRFPDPPRSRCRCASRPGGPVPPPPPAAPPRRGRPRCARRGRQPRDPPPGPPTPRRSRGRCYFTVPPVWAARRSGAARRRERARPGRGTPEPPDPPDPRPQRPARRGAPSPEPPPPSPGRTAAAHGAGVAAGGGSSRRLAMALPRTLGELQLYRVLQRANLLGYYETFIQQGGDDVQQLCEAGEEEFLEIMALVGMATKPLHVRRLQKALREWASNPGLFSQPVSAVPVSSIPLFKLSEAGGRKALSNGHASPGEATGKGGGSAGTPPARSPTEPGEKLSPSAAPPWPGRSTPESEGGGDEEPGGPPFSPGGSGGEQPVGAEALEPELARTVAESVERLLQSCPRGGEAELRALMKLNKKLAKAVGHIFQLEDGDRHKEEEIRRHSAIYGRGEARRREGKQLTLHELIINEAAAQFCLRDNSLLLRRVELFSLSRQVARESTYLSSLKVARAHPEESGATAAKRLKQEAGEQSRPELLPLPVGPEPPGAAYRASLEEDAASLSGESLDGHLQAVGACPRLTPPPGAAPDVPLGLPPHGLWSRHILQQTLMDEGLRLARLVSHERVGRLSPCLPGKPPGPEFEDGLAERGPPAPPDPPRGTIKVEQETSRQ